MVHKRFYNIEEIATILGKSISSIYGHLHRDQHDAVPWPIKTGRRLAWPIEVVEEWIAQKKLQAEIEAHMRREDLAIAPKPKGRPTKAETVKRRREGHDDK